MAKPVNHSDTRQQLLRAALKHFANSGYAATSVQHIVDDAKLSKPALYYHFKDKAGLFQALVHEAHAERYRMLCQAAENNAGLDRHFDSQELAFGFYGTANFYLVGHLVCEDCQPDQLTAKRIVELFLAGAGPKLDKVKKQTKVKK